MAAVACRRAAAGLARVALAAGVSASLAPSARADDIFAGLQRVFGLPAVQPQPVRPASSAGVPRRPRLKAGTAGRPRYASLGVPGFAVITTFAPLPGGPDLSGAVDPAFVTEEAKAFAGALSGRRNAGWMGGRQTMCVRLCDGYAFPVGRLHGSGDLPLHATACEAACPGAATVLFSRPEGAEGMEAAVSVGGRPYATLRTAYAYRQRLVPACGCHGGGEQRAYTPLPLNRDRTLRAGDVVMGKASAFVLMAGRVPAFEDYRSSGALTKTERLRMRAVVADEAPRSPVRVRLTAQAVAPSTGPREPSAVRVVLPSPY